jgi:hypothetical protein
VGCQAAGVVGAVDFLGVQQAVGEPVLVGVPDGAGGDPAEQVRGHHRVLVLAVDVLQFLRLKVPRTCPAARPLARRRESSRHSNEAQIRPNVLDHSFADPLYTQRNTFAQRRGTK